MWIVVARLGLAALMIGAETVGFYFVGKWVGKSDEEERMLIEDGKKYRELQEGDEITMKVK